MGMTESVLDVDFIINAERVNSGLTDLSKEQIEELQVKEKEFCEFYALQVQPKQKKQSGRQMRQKY